MPIETRTRTELNSFLDDSIVTNQNDFITAAIPVGRTVTVQRFGGSAEADGLPTPSRVLLQWGDAGGGFETIRALYLSGTAAEVVLNLDFDGDGTKRLRIRRVNSSIAAKRISAWATGYRRG